MGGRRRSVSVVTHTHTNLHTLSSACMHLRRIRSALRKKQTEIILAVTGEEKGVKKRYTAVGAGQ